MVQNEQADVQNEELRKAEEYLAKNRVMELFNDLCASLCFHKPEDVRGFLLQELAMRENEGAEHGFFEDAEITAVFGLADLMQTGIISAEQAKTALLSLANSQKQKEFVDGMSFPEEVDVNMFRQFAKDALKNL
eukprot:CAMPEP_0115385718 /NCGR_PEP_ID=MMETSP0271-20121206/7773_1 /TAXON_ID=71861 /ORGANISM="Scrippsiella trochoidea, Strain CCMP3099" /LENGTH=133 /DNA_ID=CAMNT_0002809123 /DNA_START=64 /DNA_END=465 /DNA_ORIENTATION=-